MAATRGRRISWVDGSDPVHLLKLPGDYTGPVMGFSGDRPAVFYLLPGSGRLAHVCSPPHRFTEEANGTLTIRESILSRWEDPEPQSWHGYLTGGIWTEC